MEILKKLFPVTLLVISLSFSANAQIAFERAYGNSGEEVGRSMVQLADSSYIVVGSSSSFGMPGADLLILKLDSTGEVIWTKTKGGAQIDRAMKIVHTSDGNLAIVGYTNSFGAGGYDVYFLKINYNGHVLLSKTYGGSDWDLGYSLVETSDGGFLITGETYSSGSGLNDAFLLKIDAVGDTVWAREYGGTGSEIGRSVEVTTSGDILLAAETSSSGAGQSDAWALKLDASGNVLWDQTFGYAENDYGTDLIELTNGRLIFTWTSTESGNDYWSANMSKLSSTTGDQVNIITHANPYNMIINQTMEYPNRGTTMSVGMQEPNANGSDVWSLGNDTTGGMWFDSGCPGFGNTFGNNGVDLGYDIIPCNDGGFALVGVKEVAVGYTSVFVVKMMDDCLGTGIVLEDSVFVTGITELEKNVTIYPNPSNGNFTVDLETGKGTIRVFASSGKLIYEDALGPHANSFQLHLSNGMYVVEIQSGNGVIRRKLTVVN